MNESNNAVGNENTRKLKQNRKSQFPIDSIYPKKLTPIQASTVYAILRKSPTEKWSDISKRLGISTRHLFNLRLDDNVVSTVNYYSFGLLDCDLSDVLKALSEKAKLGDVGAIKLFLEQTNALKQLENKIGANMERSRQAFQRIMLYLSPEQKEIILSEFAAVTKAWQEGNEEQNS